MLKILSIISAVLVALGFADYANIIDGFASVLPDWIAAFAILVTAAAPLAAVTPWTWDNKVIKIARAVFNALGFNFGAAKNKVDDE